MDWKRLVKKVLYPPIWLMVLLTLVCTAALITIFVLRWEMSPLAYVVYVLSAYTLTVLSIFFALVFPKRYRAIKQKVYEHPLGNRYMTDAAFRTYVSLYVTLVVNLLYVAVNILSGVLYKTAWFGILAGYYTIMAVMRFLLLRFVNRQGIGTNYGLELRRARLCGIILMAINLTLSGAVLMILYQDKGYEYSGILIYVMAAYTFFITVHAIISLVKYRKYNSPIMLASKSISLASALVSMLALETAMLSQFGKETTPLFRRVMVASTGAGVSIIVITMSIYTIIKANKEIRRIKP